MIPRVVVLATLRRSSLSGRLSETFDALGVKLRRPLYDLSDAVLVSRMGCGGAIWTYR